jgi:hypothetical protein
MENNRPSRLHIQNCPSCRHPTPIPTIHPPDFFNLFFRPSATTMMVDGGNKSATLSLVHSFFLILLNRTFTMAPRNSRNKKKKAVPLAHPPTMKSRKKARKVTTLFHKLTVSGRRSAAGVGIYQSCFQSFLTFVYSSFIAERTRFGQGKG